MVAWYFRAASSKRLFQLTLPLSHCALQRCSLARYRSCLNHMTSLIRCLDVNSSSSLTPSACPFAACTCLISERQASAEWRVRVSIEVR